MKLTEILDSIAGASPSCRRIHGARPKPYAARGRPTCSRARPDPEGARPRRPGTPRTQRALRRGRPAPRSSWGWSACPRSSHSLSEVAGLGEVLQLVEHSLGFSDDHFLLCPQALRVAEEVPDLLGERRAAEAIVDRDLPVDLGEEAGRPGPCAGHTNSHPLRGLLDLDACDVAGLADEVDEAAQLLELRRGRIRCCGYCAHESSVRRGFRGFYATIIIAPRPDRTVPRWWTPPRLASRRLESTSA